MKRKGKNWDHVVWTPLVQVEPNPEIPEKAQPHAVFYNSIYQVSVWYGTAEPFGDYAHLSFKTHDRQPRHDWREMQAIKNEVCGPECEAVEIYPAESRLVDTCNQYHLWVFRTYKLPIGFRERLVGDGSGGLAKQRAWKAPPADFKSKAELDALVVQHLGVPLP